MRFAPDPGRLHRHGRKGSFSWIGKPRALLAGLALGLMGALPVQAQTALSPEAQEEVRALVHDYIMNNPEVLVEALQAMEERERAEAEARQLAALDDLKQALTANPASPVSGNPDGDITIVEFFDYQCGYCKRIMPDLVALLEDDPGVRIVWKEWPILGPASEAAARAALAVHRLAPDRYLAFHREIMGERGRLTENKILRTLSELGLDLDEARAEMTSEAVGAYLAETADMARMLGLTGTPWLLVGDTPVPGAVGPERLRAIIAQERAEAG